MLQEIAYSLMTGLAHSPPFCDLYTWFKIQMQGICQDLMEFPKYLNPRLQEVSYHPYRMAIISCCTKEDPKLCCSDILFDPIHDSMNCPNNLALHTFHGILEHTAPFIHRWLGNAH